MAEGMDPALVTAITPASRVTGFLTTWLQQAWMIGARVAIPLLGCVAGSTWKMVV